MIRAMKIEAVINPLVLLAFDGWVWLTTRGMRPDSPYWARYAIKRATLRGGVRL